MFDPKTQPSTSSVPKGQHIYRWVGRQTFFMGMGGMLLCFLPNFKGNTFWNHNFHRSACDIIKIFAALGCAVVMSCALIGEVVKLLYECKPKISLIPPNPLVNVQSLSNTSCINDLIAHYCKRFSFSEPTSTLLSFHLHLCFVLQIIYNYFTYLLEEYGMEPVSMHPM